MAKKRRKRMRSLAHYLDRPEVKARAEELRPLVDSAAAATTGTDSMTVTHAALESLGAAMRRTTDELLEHQRRELLAQVRRETRGRQAAAVLQELLRDPSRTTDAIATAAGCNRTAIYNMAFGALTFCELRQLVRAGREGRHDGIEAVDDRLPDGRRAKAPAKRRRK